MKTSTIVFAASLLATFCTQANATPPPKQARTLHNIVLFIPDGLRAGIVNAQSAPTLYTLSQNGVHFANTHSLYPTLTMPNSSAIATGHYFGDTGVFGNVIYTAFPVPGAGGSVTPFMENDAVLSDVDEHFAGNYLDEQSVLAAARAAGLSTAAVGKLGPVTMQDVSDLSGNGSIIVDDSTGYPGGIPLSPEFSAALQQAGLTLKTPGRGENGKTGDATTAGTHSANVEQQQYFVDVATRVILPRLKAAGKPFILVFWSRDPDGSQHNQGDSLGQLVPGINGPTSMAGIRNADDNLASIMAALKHLGLDSSTDIFVTADHGFSTISKQSATSTSAKASYKDVPTGQLPPGFLAIDIADALHLPLADPDAKSAAIDWKANQHPSRGNGLLGDPAAPEIVVAADGGSDLIYLPQANAGDLAPKVVQALLGQDYVSGIFIDDSLGAIPGTLPLSTIHLKGLALTPHPAIVVNFRSFDTGCGKPEVCSAEVADTTLQQGQGMHGSFGRGDTANFMAAIGPDFRAGYIDHAPSSNADVGATLAHLLKLQIPQKGKLVGRVLTETLKGGKQVHAVSRMLKSTPAENGLQTQIRQQFVGVTPYFDAAGFTGRTVGLDPASAK